MKKFALILLSIALVLSCTIIAFADPATTHTITINDPIKKETYTAYKIFDVTYTTSTGSSTADKFSYTITPASEWWSVVTTPASGGVTDPETGATLTISTPADLLALSSFTVDKLTFAKTDKTVTVGGTQYHIYNVTHDERLYTDADARALAAKLYANVTGKTPSGSPATASNADPSTASITVPEDGYYFVTTSAGALCSLTTTTPNAEIDEKNDIPTIEKNVSEDGNTWADEANAAFGETVYFKITITDKVGTDQAMTVSDTMNNGLTLNTTTVNQGGTDTQVPDITVVAGGTTYRPGQQGEAFTVTPAADSRSFMIEFPSDFVTALAENQTIVITYGATVGSDAYIRGNTDDTSASPAAEAFNTNTVTLEYSQQVMEDTVTVYTYKFQIVKTTSDRYGKKYLEGATFKLYDANGTEIPVVQLPAVTGDRTNRYRFATADEITNGTTCLIEGGLAEIDGVDKDATYYLEEIEAPAGYNKLTSRLAVTVTEQNYLSQIVHFVTGDDTTYLNGGTRVVNMTGGELPHTGGIGTYLFYGVGAILIVGAVVVLVSKKRMHAYSE